MNEDTTRSKKRSNPLVHLLNHHIAARQGSSRRRRNSSLLVLILFITASIGVITSYRQLLGSSANNDNTLDNYIEGSGAPPLPPYENFWDQPLSSCIHVDNICSQNDNWFYAPTTNNFNKDTYQPNIRLVLNRTEIVNSHGHDIFLNKDIKFDVKSSSYWYYDEEKCSYSDAPHHLVVQSSYNHMIGEFYSRTMLGLNQWMRDYPPKSNDDIQTYVHFVDKRKGMLEGHKLFLSGLPNNNEFGSFMKLMPSNNDNSDSCQCYRKLIFCGYDVTKHNITTSTSHSSDDDNNNRIDTAYTIKPRGNIQNKKSDCQWNHPNCISYRKLRRDLLVTYSQKDKDLDYKIRQYQTQILVDKGIHNTNVDGYKFIGLAHRKYRRIWLNIDDAIEMCDRKYRPYKIICLKVDVEEAKTSEEQFLMHRSLHAFVGIHGAQLTQGVLLPTHGYILELLPWVPWYLWGAWVATTHCPTPLGIIFSKTVLNHIGYPLDRESVPLCLEIDRSDEEAERHCLMNETSKVVNKFRWADRDFNVKPRVIEDFILSFLLKENNELCHDVEKRANETNFVVYNAFCKENAKHKQYVARQFYKDEEGSKAAHDANLHTGQGGYHNT